MARIVEVSPRFQEHARRSQLDTEQRKKLGLAMGRLGRAHDLPGPGDYAALIPPNRLSYVHRLAAENIWLWYSFTDAYVLFSRLTTTPPVPLDE